MKTWILVASSSVAHLYKTDNLRNGDLTTVKEFVHPQSREKGSDLITDGPGHLNLGNTAHSTYEKTAPKELEADHFSRELVHALNTGHNNHEFDQLILVAAPHFYGLINKHLNFNLDKIIHIPKDYTKLKGRELLDSLHKFLYK
jgi:protein required for attachment to host cells